MPQLRNSCRCQCMAVSRVMHEKGNRSTMFPLCFTHCAASFVALMPPGIKINGTGFFQLDEPKKAKNFMTGLGGNWIVYILKTLLKFDLDSRGKCWVDSQESCSHTCMQTSRSWEWLLLKDCKSSSNGCTLQNGRLIVIWLLWSLLRHSVAVVTVSAVLVHASCVLLISSVSRL